MTMTVGDALSRTVGRFPDRTFLTDGNRELTFRQVSDRIDRICSALLALGLRRHDRLALWLPNSPEWVLIALACARLGILVVTVSTRNKAEETAYILSKSRANALFMLDRYWDIDYRDLLAQAIPSFSTGDGSVRDPGALPHLEHIVMLDGASADFGLPDWTARFEDDHAALAEAQGVVQASDPLLAIFTSGTTGFPKGAVHSHIFLRNAENVARGMQIEAGDVILGHMPFHHVAGLVTALFPAMLVGCTLVTVAHWQPDAVARLISDRRVNIFGGIPTHFIDLADAVARASLDTSCLKSAWIGGASISPDVARRTSDILRLDALLAAYGMTETTGCTTLSRFDDPLEMACEGKGVPVGDFEVKVVDPRSGAQRGAEEDGEIWVRGHIVMAEYLEDPEETANAMTGDGWFRTGDLGRLDSRGYLRITGRLKEMFIVGGSNVYPAEVERCLQQMPGVRQAAVVGVPEPRLGEVGFAFVEPDGSASIGHEDVIRFARARLADYKVPRHVAFVTAFPMTGTHKIQRHILVSDAIKRLDKAAAT